MLEFELGGLFDDFFDVLREFDRNKIFGRVEVVLTGFVNHTDHPLLPGVAIGQLLVDFAEEQRSLLPLVMDADHEFLFSVALHRLV
jgi:hypothetical protein